MLAKVVGASALAAVAFNEPEREEVLARLEGVETFFAPTLVQYELASVCRKKRKQRPEDAEALRAALVDVLSLRLRTTTPAPAFVEQVAEQHGLTVYDAAYLGLALILEVDLVTLDRDLDAAWRAAR